MTSRRPIGHTPAREPDARLISEGLKAPGMDTREWIDYGTVASLRDDDGQPDFSDPNAVVIAPRGVEVDVLYGVNQTPITCKYGTQCGVGVILTPIRPGDLVLVSIPGGDPGNGGKILSVMPGPHTPLPVEDDGKPIFRNDRVSITARGVPIEIRTTGGGKVVIDEDDIKATNPNGAVVELTGDGDVKVHGGEVNMNEGTQGVARLQDTVEVTISPTDLAVLASALLLTGVFTPSGNPPAPGPPVPLTNGQITSASTSVKAGG